MRKLYDDEDGPSMGTGITTLESSRSKGTEVLKQKGLLLSTKCGTRQGLGHGPYGPLLYLLSLVSTIREENLGELRRPPSVFRLKLFFVSLFYVSQEDTCFDWGLLLTNPCHYGANSPRWFLSDETYSHLYPCQVYLPRTGRLPG